MTGWDSIDTAPRDGTVILGCEWVSRERGEYTVIEVEWIEWIEGGSWRLASTCWADETTRADPTHWMPRPAAPKLNRTR